ncbi:MAG TPA: methyltransferase type 11, partial [Acetobacteraceae bacterium]|nr:methyltransferase type 11 [Acetobacteraceae bacterium]
QPYSFGQIGRLLAASLYRVERRDTALYLPPSNLRLVLRGGPLCERTGRRWLPGLAGVTITEAVKDIYAAMPVEAVPRRRLVLAEAA